MNSSKIIITDKLEPNGHAILKDHAHVDDCSGISADELITTIPKYDAVIVRSRTKLTSEVFAAASRLRVAGRAGVGVDNIDLTAAQAQGVIVVNAPTGITAAVAEHTLALMLALARAIPRADSAMKSGQWHKNALVGTELAGKTLGVIGPGRIGAQVATRAAAFGMRVLGYTPLETAEEIRARGLEPATLTDIYAQSDFITLHMPLTPETRRMIDGQALARMKAGVYIISAARGGIIDETALTAALESGQVAGAALDVFAQEPPGLSALVAHPHLIATPHIASQTKEAQARTAALIAEEVLAALAGEPLRWQIV